ncbi:MAG: hypothetical protein GZ085_10520 [Sulfuriferula multivorans]|uniref:Uncharacterized protein n=1 Tax=Sulfuriferula multivorans TaxID=1559896 RepID=A0A7C9T9U3_9PROT|nr:hypothetical protein [Sulfuriferula multivorans]
MSSLLRHQMIVSLATPPAEKGADAAMTLWEKLSTKIIAIIGAGGFQSLYARSLFIAQAQFPWLATDEVPKQTDQLFAQLKKYFESQTPVQASAANSLLLITLTDILASLIGEALTTSILRSAWDSDASVLAGKGFRNE